MTPTVTQLAQRLITHFEGCNLTPYQCPAGHWSIGYGSTTLADGTAVTCHTPPLTQAETNTLLTRQLQLLQHDVLDAISIPLTSYQAAALISFTYNVGLHNLITSTLRAQLNTGALNKAADEFLRWNHVNGTILPGLTRRRQMERAVFLGEETIPFP